MFITISLTGTTDSDYSDVDTKKSQSPVSPKTPPLSLMPNKSAVKRKHEGFFFVKKKVTLINAL